MQVLEPNYYASFRCLAEACPDSCCKEWEVLVDQDSAARYQALPGDLGDRLRAVMKTEDGEVWFTLEDRRCPMWRGDGLCRIQAELGEAELCQTCAQFPRLCHEYGDFVELGLELSCPEAARLILSAPAAAPISREIPGGEAPDYDPDAMALLRDSRQRVLALIDDPSLSVEQILGKLLLYAYDVDEFLNFPEDTPEPPEPLTRQIPVCSDDGTITMWDLFELYRGLEILTPRWEQALRSGPRPAPWTDDFRPLIRYFVERYWLQAISDLDLASRAKFIAVSCLMIRHLGMALLPAAQLYSKEIENDAENVNTLLDASFTAPELTDDAILRLISQP